MEGLISGKSLYVVSSLMKVLLHEVDQTFTQNFRGLEKLQVSITPALNMDQ